MGSCSRKSIRAWVLLTSLSWLGSAQGADPRADAWEKQCQSGRSLSCIRRGLLDFDQRAFQEAKKWFEVGCKRGDADNCVNLAACFENLGDFEAASKSYLELCKSGHPFGCNNLGVIYRDRRKDLFEAEKYFALACKKNFAPGCANLGIVETARGAVSAGIEHLRFGCQGAQEGCANLAYFELANGQKGDAEKHFGIACRKGYQLACREAEMLAGKTGAEVALQGAYKSECDKGTEFACRRMSSATGKPELRQPPVDPYKAIERLTFENGMSVYLAHSNLEKAVYFELNVQVGTNQEGSTNRGVAHVLEHLLFRNPEADKPSYLDHFFQSGIKSNAETTEDSTKYYGLAPADKGEWLVKTFSELLRNRKFQATSLEQAKKEVRLESGGLLPLLASLGGAPYQHLYEREFGVSEENNPLASLGLGVGTLQLQQAQKFFEAYYHPKNFVLTIAGNFDREPMIKAIREFFGNAPVPAQAKTTESVPRIRNRPYLFSAVSPFTHRIQIGTKAWDLQPQDELILVAYFKMLSQSLMRELRTEKAETYSVIPRLLKDTRKFGIFTVDFETTAEAYSRNLDFVRKKIENETRSPGLTNIELLEMKAAYLSGYGNFTPTVESLVQLIEHYRSFEATFPGAGSPFEVMNALTPDEIRARLPILFQKEKGFELTLRPPLLFVLDSAVFCLFALAIGYLIPTYLRRRRAHALYGEVLVEIVHVSGMPKVVRRASKVVLILVWLGGTGFVSRYLMKSSEIFYSDYVLRDYGFSVLAALLLGGFVGLIRHPKSYQSSLSKSGPSSHPSSDQPPSMAA